jgi:hypothetical protein
MTQHTTTWRCVNVNTLVEVLPSAGWLKLGVAALLLCEGFLTNLKERLES